MGEGGAGWSMQRQCEDAKAQEMEDEATEAGRGQMGGHLLPEGLLQLARIRWREGGEGWGIRTSVCRGSLVLCRNSSSSRALGPTEPASPASASPQKASGLC